MKKYRKIPYFMGKSMVSGSDFPLVVNPLIFRTNNTWTEAPTLEVTTHEENSETWGKDSTTVAGPPFLGGNRWPSDFK